MLNVNKKLATITFISLLAITLIAGCGGPEAKKQKFFAKGKDFYEKGDYVKARLELKNAIQIDPKFADAYYLLGLVSLKTGNFKDAFGSFMKTVELNPAHVDSQVQIGKLYLLDRKPDTALEKAELALKTNPSHEEALLLKGQVYLAKQQSDAARQSAEGLLAQGYQATGGISAPLVCPYAERQQHRCRGSPQRRA